MTQEESEPAQDFWDGSGHAVCFKAAFQLSLTSLCKSYDKSPSLWRPLGTSIDNRLSFTGACNSERKAVHATNSMASIR